MVTPTAEAKLNVQLLSMTEDPVNVIYAAFRQCYYPGFVGDLWDKLEPYLNDVQLNEGEISYDKQEELIASTCESGHVSPIEHVSFTFAIEGISRSLTHQLVRHRIASYSQQSQRYCDGSDFTYVIPKNIRDDERSLKMFLDTMDAIRKGYVFIKERQEFLGNKKSSEDARCVLPQAAETRIVVTMNCRSLLNFFEHRCCMRAQLEIRNMADAMLAICRDKLPVLFNLAGAKCERLGFCPEGAKFTCGKYPLR